MNEGLQTQYGSSYDADLATQQQRVLRNTYWLLALSMVPTVLGAWIGVSTGIVAGLGVGASTMLFLGGAWGLMYVIHKTKNSSAGVVALLGFTFFMGLMLSRLLIPVLGFRNGASLVMTAFGGTATIFFVMASLATVIKRDLSSMGKFLLVGVVILFIAGIANIFLQSSALMMTILVAVLGVFSALMLYDIKRIIDGGETNYVWATLNLYLDAYNVFQSLLSLLGIFGGDRD